MPQLGNVLDARRKRQRRPFLVNCDDLSGDLRPKARQPRFQP